MSYNFGVIPMDEDDRQMINDEQAWMEFSKKLDDTQKTLIGLSGDCLYISQQVGDEHLEDAVCQLRDYLLEDVKSIIKTLQGICDERPR